MTIAARLKKFLNAHNVGYHILSHTKTLNFQEALEELHIPNHQFACSIGLMDAKGILIAVVPSDAKLNLPILNKKMRRDFKIVPKLILDKIYFDCEPGEHPPIAEPYGVNMIIDSAFNQCARLYFSSGSHSSLLKMSQDDFRYLTANQKWWDISLKSKKLVSF